MRESRTYGSGRGACHETHVPTATTAASSSRCSAARRRGRSRRARSSPMPMIGFLQSPTTGRLDRLTRFAQGFYANSDMSKARIRRSNIAWTAVRSATRLAAELGALPDRTMILRLTHGWRPMPHRQVAVDRISGRLRLASALRCRNDLARQRSARSVRGTDAPVTWSRRRHLPAVIVVFPGYFVLRTWLLNPKRLMRKC